MHGSCSEIYLEEAFRSRGITPAAMGRGTLHRAGRLSNARRLGETSLTFLMHHTIDEATMRNYANRARRCIRAHLTPPGTRFTGPETAADPR